MEAGDKGRLETIDEDDDIEHEEWTEQSAWMWWECLVYGRYGARDVVEMTMDRVEELDYPHWG